MMREKKTNKKNRKNCMWLLYTHLVVLFTRASFFLIHMQRDITHRVKESTIERESKIKNIYMYIETTVYLFLDVSKNETNSIETDKDKELCVYGAIWRRACARISTFIRK